MLKRFFAAASAMLMAGAIALAANTTFFTSIGDQVFPFTAPLRDGSAGEIDNMVVGATTPRAGTFTTVAATTVTASQVNASLGSYGVNPASTTTYPAYTFSTNQSRMIFTPTGTTSYAYVTMAASPRDGQESCLFSAGIITALYTYANAGQSIVGGISTIAANAHACFTYSLSNTTWYRSQ